jgi:hypothetical protein
MQPGNNLVSLPHSVQTSALINVATLLNTASCRPYVNRRFGRTYHFNLQGRKSAEQAKDQLIFDSEDGDDMFFRNVGLYTDCKQWLGRFSSVPEDGSDTVLRNVGSYTDYSALYLGRWQHSSSRVVCLTVQCAFQTTERRMTIQ